MADVFRLQSVTGTEYATIDDSGNINATGELRIDGVAVASVDTSGNISIADSKSLVLGTGSDDSVSHNGTNTLWTHTTGDLTFDNQLVTGSTIFLLGTDTTATDFQVQTNSANAVFSVTPSSATAGTTLVAGTLDLNGTLDQDFALTGTGDGANITGTMTHATQSAEGLDVSIAQLTNARTGGVLAAVKTATTSLAGDNGGTYANIHLSHTDGGGTTTHVGIYGDTALDGLLMASATGKMGVVVGAMTAKSPENDAEAGYISIYVGTTRYEIPFYAVA